MFLLRTRPFWRKKSAISSCSSWRPPATVFEIIYTKRSDTKQNNKQRTGRNKRERDGQEDKTTKGTRKKKIHKGVKTKKGEIHKEVDPKKESIHKTALYKLRASFPGSAHAFPFHPPTSLPVLLIIKNGGQRPAATSYYRQKLSILSRQK